MEEKQYEYKFSIIMAVYNVEQYVDEAINSIIKQKIGFEENVQLILIDDGSSDSSGEICDRYAEMYPNNIISLHKENGGVSSARNLGLKYARGKYLNFMDSDDRLSLNTLSDIDMFFDIYKDRVDIISIPFEFFERMTGRNIPHNRKFSKGNRIIDLNKEFDAFQFSLGAAFLRAEACKDMCFDETMILSEDAKEIYKLFLKKPFLGICCSACYYYRKRAVAGSAVDSSGSKAINYTAHLRSHYLFMVQNYLENWGYVPDFVQYAVMYDLQWKIRMQHIPEGVLSDDEISEFKSEFNRLMSYISPKIVLSMKDLSVSQKISAINRINPDILKVRETLNDTNIYIEDTDEESKEEKTTSIMWLSSSRAMINTIKYKGKVLEIEGSANVPLVSESYNFEVFAKVNGRIERCEYVERHADLYSLDELYEKCVGFKFRLAASPDIEKYDISFFVNYYGNIVLLNSIDFTQYAPLSKQLANAFYYSEDRILTFKKNAFTFKLAGKKSLMKHEFALRKEIKKTQFCDYKTVLKLRTRYYLHKLLFKKPIWLISDRIDKADDNGEAFYLYMKKNKNIKSYFVIDKKYKKDVKKLGKIITIGSFKHMLYSLLAKKVVSSQIENKTLYNLSHNTNLLKDLYAPDRLVFLQHGIIKDDISSVYNRFSKNISLFISSCKPEYDSLLYYNYGFDKTNLAMTGLPRFDRLYNDNKKIITIMPTWRKSLAKQYNSQTGEWEYANDFTKTEYYNFYNDLLNNEKLLESLNEKGYKLSFAPHPNLKKVKNLFSTDKVFVWGDESYRKIFAESALIVTDYSSAVFDFAYLNKPIIYSQFDKESFYQAQSFSKGYFDYESMGFGEVEYNLDDTVDKIIEYVNNDCKLKPIYQERVNSFFAFHDKDNCKRVYEAIISSL